MAQSLGEQPGCCPCEAAERKHNMVPESTSAEANEREDREENNMTATEKNVLNVAWLYNQTPEAGGDRNTLKMLRLVGLEALAKSLCGRTLAASHHPLPFSTRLALRYITRSYHPTRSLFYFGNNSKHCLQQKFGTRWGVFFIIIWPFPKRSPTRAGLVGWNSV